MAETDLIKIAYRAIQQSKGIAGLAHKQISTKIMEAIAPEAIPNTDPISPEILNEIRRSMEERLVASVVLYPADSISLNCHSNPPGDVEYIICPDSLTANMR